MIGAHLPIPSQFLLRSFFKQQSRSRLFAPLTSNRPGMKSCFFLLMSASGFPPFFDVRASLCFGSLEEKDGSPTTSSEKRKASSEFHEMHEQRFPMQVRSFLMSKKTSSLTQTHWERWKETALSLVRRSSLLFSEVSGKGFPSLGF